MQHCVPLEIRSRQGLFNHLKIEFVQRLEVIDVLPSVGAVGINHQRNISEAMANRLQRFEIPSGLDLDLEAFVPFVEVCLDRCNQLPDGRIDPDREPRLHLSPASTKGAIKRLLLILCSQIPEGRFNARFGKCTPRNPIECVVHLVNAGRLL